MKHVLDTRNPDHWDQELNPQEEPLNHFPQPEDETEKQAIYKRLVSLQEKEIQISNQPPYRYVAQLIAGLYCLFISLVAGWIQCFNRVQIGSIHRKLAEIYYYVPEMALHKSIELEAFVKHPYSGKGLDLGSGNGFVGGVLIQESQIQELHGLDCYDHNRSFTLENGYKDFSTGDIQAMPFDDKSFDYAISICVIEHLPDLRAALNETSRILRSGGRFVFSTPSPLFRESTLGYRFFKTLGMNHRALEFQKEKDIHSQQFHYLSSEQWKTTLESLGFCDVHVEGIFSQRQLLIYDLMNFQVYWPRFYFADKLYNFLLNRPLFKNWMMNVTAFLSAYFSQEKPELEKATHYLISCSRQ